MSTKTITIETVRDEVRRMDPQLSDDDGHFAAAVVLLTVAATDLYRVRDIAAFTQIPYKLVRDYVRRLRSHGVLTADHKLAVEWFQAGGGMAFWLDVNVALGRMTRAPEGSEK